MESCDPFRRSRPTFIASLLIRFNRAFSQWHSIYVPHVWDATQAALRILLVANGDGARVRGRAPLGVDPFDSARAGSRSCPSPHELGGFCPTVLPRSLVYNHKFWLPAWSYPTELSKL